MNSANYALAKSSTELDVRNKKLLYGGIIHSHLIYGLPIWGLYGDASLIIYDALGIFTYMCNVARIVLIKKSVPHKISFYAHH